MAAQTLFKMSPADYQALQALLCYLARQITENQFETILKAQGRSVGNTASYTVQLLAEALVKAVR